MSVLALVTDENSIAQVLPWALTFSRARDDSLIVLCWTEAPLSSAGESGPWSEANANLVSLANEFFTRSRSPVQPEIIGVSSPSQSKAAIDLAKEKQPNLIVATAEDPTGKMGTSYSSNALLKQSPCTTAILFGGPGRSLKPKRIFVGATDSTHDVASVVLAGQLSDHFKSRITLARAELEPGQEGQEVGRRELTQLMRDASIDENSQTDFEVFATGDFDAAASSMDENDLVLLAANSQQAPAVIALAVKPTVAIIKRAPPLRLWQPGQQPTSWTMRLNPADYAELFQGLRRGSRLGADFLIMLSLAAVVASMGLLQNSPAVVIGSMLLAPLMTPMIGCGLALAQANQMLGNAALRTVLLGLMCTLLIGFLVGTITPGDELTPQVLARGQPTILDLVVALASAAAASYALARPNLVGSIAGVAIATALVPPLCSVGISLAYADTANAQGAALLFVTNFLAIVLCSALTFRLIGITPRHSATGQRFWVFRVVTVFSLAIILIAVPLQNDFMDSLVQTKPQPRTYPLAKTVIEALEEKVQAEPGASLIAAGRPSSQFAASDVIIILGCTGDPGSGLADTLTQLVRSRMLDDSLVVEVHCVKELWEKTSP